MIELLIGAGVCIAGYSALNGMSTYNRLMALDERCTTAFADIDVLMKHRHSMIPGIVEMVKGYCAHEVGVINAVLQARVEALRAIPQTETHMQAETQLGQSLTNLFQVAEKYPDSRASQHFTELRNTHIDVENRITASRRFYNISVDEHNATLRQFPGNIIAAKMRLHRRAQFTLGVERVLMDEAVQMNFASA